MRSRLVGLAADIPVIDGNCQPNPFLVGDTVHRQPENASRAKTAANILMLVPAHVRKVACRLQETLELLPVLRYHVSVVILTGSEKRPQECHQGLRHTCESMRCP